MGAVCEPDERGTGVNIIDHPSPNHSPRKAGVRVDTVVIHHTGSDSLYSAATWMCDPKSGVSAHYVIGRGGQVFRLVPESRKAWHAGVACLPWEKGPWKVRGRTTDEGYGWFNDRSIGIEVVNPGDGVTPFTEAQYAALEWLVRYVVGRLDGPPLVRPTRAVADPRDVVYVLGHRDVAPGRKTDPADNFDWGRIRKALTGSST